MSGLPSNLSVNLGLRSQPISLEPQSPKTVGNKATSTSVAIELNTSAQVAKSTFLRSLDNQSSKTGVTTTNLISKKGLVGILGGQGKFKDFLLKIKNGMSGNPAPTSHFTSAKRFASRYEDLCKTGGSEDEKLEALRGLKTELLAHNAKGKEERQIRGLVGVIDREIEKTCSDYRDALAMIENMPHLNKDGASLDDKLAHLTGLRTKLQSSIDKGIDKASVHESLESVNKAISTITNFKEGVRLLEDLPNRDFLTDREGAQTLLGHLNEAKSGGVDHPEITKLIDGLSHLKAAHQLMDRFRGIDQMPFHALEEGVSQKLRNLTETRDRLLEAEKCGVTNPALRTAIDDLEQSISEYQGKTDLAKGLGIFHREGGLKPVKGTSEVSGLGGAMKEHVDKAYKASPLKQQLNEEIVSQSIKLKHPEEQHIVDPLEYAKEEFRESSLGDARELTGPGRVDDAIETFHDPKLSDLGFTPQEIKELGDQYAALLTHDDSAGLEQFSLALGTRIAEKLRNLPKETQFAYTTSTGKALQAELYREMAAQNPQHHFPEGEFDKLSSKMTAPLKQAYDHAVSQLDDRQIDDNTLRIGGKDFVKGRTLGEGANGKVAEYIWNDPNGLQPSIRIAVKQAIFSGNEDTLEENCREVRLHKQAMGGGHSNLIELTGAIRTPSGDMLIAMEMAPYGDVFEATAKIEQAIKDGLISQQAGNAMRLTLFKDMMEGMKHMQESRNMIHVDIKPLNYFIGEDGVAKLGDFGTSFESGETEASKNPVENSRWQAPEILRGEDELKDVRRKLIAGYKSDLEKELLAVERRLEGASRQEIDQAKSLIRQQHNHMRDKALETLSFEISGKIDTWALGISAYEMFVKEGPFNKPEFATETERREAIVKWAEDERNRLMPSAKDKDGEVIGKGVGALDRLLNQMIAPNPDDRISLTDALKSSVFEDSGVGTPEARELIKALTSRNPDPEAIRKAATELGL